jgi:tRNA pseudouridine55 synthase
VTGTPDGIAMLDKPAGLTSHDVVGRCRRILRTRRVGHAGTLDPMATGVLVIGVGRATRLLGHLSAADKDYDAVIRLGQATTTDDAEGEVLSRASAAVPLADLQAAVARLTGVIDQVPSSVSAIKVGGRRAYERVRSGEEVELPARTVTISSFEVRDVAEVGDFLDLAVSVTCSAGTYVRALARDLGADLGVGGHLRQLRRTRSGSVDVADCQGLDDFEADPKVLPLAEALDRNFARLDVDAESAAAVGHGRSLPAIGAHGPVAVFGPGGTALALMAEDGDRLRPLAVFA